MPHRYYFLEPNYDKMDKDEYDFSRYNHSPFTGLDSTLPNSYSNNMIQSLYFIRPLKAGIIGHVCKKEYCLICELGFLFHMLDIAPKQNPCQASNFLRAFRTMPEASALNLILSNDEICRKQLNYAKLSQQWLRFILSQLDSEAIKGLTEVSEVFEESADDKQTESKQNETSFISELFSLSLLRCYKCRCDHRWEQPHNSFPITLIYPTNESTKCTSFVDLLKHSILNEQTIQTYCEKCSKFQSVNEKREAKQIPHILAINTGVDNDQAIRFWKNQTEDMPGSVLESFKLSNSTKEVTNSKRCRYGSNCTRSDCKFSHEKDYNSLDNKDIISWIPLAFSIRIDENGKLDITTDSKEGDGYVEYELISITSVVKKNEANIGNIVSAIKVDKSYYEHRSATDLHTNDWFLFNHYSIHPISIEEVVSLDLLWKLPSILMFVRKDLDSLHSKLIDLKSAINSDVFGEDQCIANKARRGSISFVPLESTEMPKKGDVVAMDAEFVTLNQEETELRADGTRTTLKPSQKSVARISCVRGFGELEGQPFIDDYIATQDQVADYMTKFSGIQPGDLDVAISSKHLTTLKSSYLKLRFLIDIGVIFIGHGLRNDFRVINLVVPSEQVIDTVQLFQSPNFKRMVSLRFLAWHFLDINIQSETHDSVEDAKTALQLYKKYLELKKLNCVDEAIDNLYDVGRNAGWRVPGLDDDP